MEPIFDDILIDSHQRFGLAVHQRFKSLLDSVWNQFPSTFWLDFKKRPMMYCILMKFLVSGFALLCALFGIFFWHSQTTDLFIISCDVLHVAIPCFGFIQSLLLGDKKGSKQFLWTCFLTAAIVEIIKLATANLSIGIRPNGRTQSFPSGHSSSSFQGALFFYRRYGYRWGIPAILLACLTSYSRVYGVYHHWRDIIVGAIIAWLVNICFVTPFKGNKRQL